MTNDEIIYKAIALKKKHNFKGHHICIIDFSRPANQHRLFVVNVKPNAGAPYIKYSSHTSHGRNSGDIYKATQFSNVIMSKKSSKGLYKTGVVYYGKYGKSLKLHGLEKGINDHAYVRAIVIHPSNYNTPEYVRRHGYPGRSWGCITLYPRDSSMIIDWLKNGSLLEVCP